VGVAGSVRAGEAGEGEAVGWGKQGKGWGIALGSIWMAARCSVYFFPFLLAPFNLKIQSAAPCPDRTQ